jgi:hypothetical protein
MNYSSYRLYTPTIFKNSRNDQFAAETIRIVGLDRKEFFFYFKNFVGGIQDTMFVPQTDARWKPSLYSRN